MKVKSHLINIWCIVLFTLLLAFAVSCSAQNDSSRSTKNMSPETTTYEVPKEKMQLWESLKKNALNDYDVCQEHCGYEQECLDRCEKAYETRLNNDYKNLIGQ